MSDIPEENTTKLEIPKAYDYYLDQARKVAEKYPSNFQDFVKGKEELVDLGNEVLSQSEATALIF